MDRELRELLNTKNDLKKILVSGRYDHAFVDSCFKRMSSTRNFGSIEKDIQNYSYSRSGIAYQHQKEAIKIIDGYANPLVVTLTCRFDLSVDEIRQKYEFLIKHLSRKVLKKAYTRHKKTIPNFGYVEGYKGGNIKAHIHAVMNCSDHFDVYEFKDLISNYWWRHVGTTKIERNASSVKTGMYLTKVTSKENNDVAKAYIKI